MKMSGLMLLLKDISCTEELGLMLVSIRKITWNSSEDTDLTLNHSRGSKKLTKNMYPESTMHGFHMICPPN